MLCAPPKRLGVHLDLQYRISLAQYSCTGMSTGWLSFRRACIGPRYVPKLSTCVFATATAQKDSGGRMQRRGRQHRVLCQSLRRRSCQ